MLHKRRTFHGVFLQSNFMSVCLYVCQSWPGCRNISPIGSIGIFGGIRTNYCPMVCPLNVIIGFVCNSDVSFDSAIIRYNHTVNNISCRRLVILRALQVQSCNLDLCGWGLTKGQSLPWTLDIEENDVSRSESAWRSFCTRHRRVQLYRPWEQPDPISN